MKKTLDLQKLMEEIESRNEEMVLYLADYDDGYIGDLISEIANNNVDIYTSDLWDWARDNRGWVEQALSEFGFNSDDGTLENLFMIAQYLYYTSEIYDNFDDFIRYALYEYLDINGVVILSEEAFDVVEDIVKNTDNNDRWDIMLGFLEEYLEED